MKTDLQTKFSAFVSVIAQHGKEVVEGSNLFQFENFMVSLDENSTTLYKENAWRIEEQTEVSGLNPIYILRGITEEEFLKVE